MRSSYSQHSCFKNCPKHWHIKYKERLEKPQTGSSLYFGTAVDTTIEYLLNQLQDLGPNIDPQTARILYEDNKCLEVFKDNWVTNIAFGKKTPIFDNLDVVYSNNDFDEQVLSPEDLNQLTAWGGTNKPVDHFKAILKKKKNPFKKLTSQEELYWNRANWLVMLRKGELLVNSFREQFMPKIKKVHSAQLRGELKDPSTGDAIVGYIDMVLEIEGHDKPIIFDLKTAARPYKPEQIELSEQLTLYTAMQGETFDTNLIGYVVLCKNINKENVSTCKKCGATKNSRHKTCNAEVDGVRCEGEWDEKIILKPEVQVMIGNRETKQVCDLLEDYSNIMLAMKNNIIYKDFSKCHNWYGKPCDFINYCHKGDKTGLVDKNRK